MTKTTGRVLARFVVVALGGCVREPFAPAYYAAPPPPLQPYMGPPLAFAAPPLASQRIVKRRYVKKRYKQVRCRCTPVR